MGQSHPIILATSHNTLKKKKKNSQNAMGQRTIKGAAQKRRAPLQLGHQGGNIKVACWDRSPDPPPG